MQRETIAKALIFNQNYDVLVLRIGTHKQYPEKSHTLDLPGGIIGSGEFERTGLVREIKEETGLQIEAIGLSLLHSATYVASERSITKLLYAAYLTNSPAIMLSWEHEAYYWMNIEQLLADSTFTTYRDAVAYVKETLLEV